MKCGVCGSKKQVKNYIIADDIERPRPRCKKCIDKLRIKLMLTLLKGDNQ